MDNNRERERFEAWWNARISPPDPSPFPRQFAWEAWQARAALDTGLAPNGLRAVPNGQTPLDAHLSHPLLKVIEEGASARDTGAASPYHGHSLEHCLHATGWVQRDLRIALDKEQLAVAPQPPASASAGKVEPKQSDVERVARAIADANEEDFDDTRHLHMALASAAIVAMGAGKVEPVAWQYRYVAPNGQEHFSDGKWVQGRAPKGVIRKGWKIEERPLYAAPPAQPVALSVKPLEWKAGDARSGQSWHVVSTLVGRWWVLNTSSGMQWVWQRDGEEYSPPFQTEDHAKAAAEADYARCVLSCITNAPDHIATAGKPIRSPVKRGAAYAAMTVCHECGASPAEGDAQCFSALPKKEG